MSADTILSPKEITPKELVPDSLYAIRELCLKKTDSVRQILPVKDNLDLIQGLFRVDSGYNEKYRFSYKSVKIKSGNQLLDIQINLEIKKLVNSLVAISQERYSWEEERLKTLNIPLYILEIDPVFINKNSVSLKVFYSNPGGAHSNYTIFYKNYLLYNEGLLELKWNYILKNTININQVYFDPVEELIYFKENDSLAFTEICHCSLPLKTITTENLLTTIIPVARYSFSFHSKGLKIRYAEDCCPPLDPISQLWNYNETLIPEVEARKIIHKPYADVIWAK